MIFGQGEAGLSFFFFLQAPYKGRPNGGSKVRLKECRQTGMLVSVRAKRKGNRRTGQSGNEKARGETKSGSSRGHALLGFQGMGEDDERGEVGG